MSPRSASREREAGGDGGGITKTGVKKTLWLHRDEAEALRVAAFEERRPESEIVREALRRYLGIAD